MRLLTLRGHPECRTKITLEVLITALYISSWMKCCLPLVNDQSDNRPRLYCAEVDGRLQIMRKAKAAPKALNDIAILT